MVELNFHPFPELKTERLLLRRITVADADMLLFLRSDPRVMEFVGREPTKNIEEASAFIELINKNIDANEAIMWGIAMKEEPAKMIGNITLWQIQAEHARADIGYMLHPGHWRKGIMKEAIARVVKFGFDSMKLHSIAAQVDSGNKASILLLEASGFIREGFFKEDFYFRGKFYDSMVYSLLNKNQS